MAVTILLLRGVNVGGVKLPMDQFRTLLTGLGLQQVQTYIQSGNAVFDDPGIGDTDRQIAAALRRDMGLNPALFLYSTAQFDAILADCPFVREGEAEGAKVHVFFRAPAAGLAPGPALDALQPFVTTERFVETPAAIYLHAPEGVGRSVWVEKAGRLLKDTTTARNWNTVRALSDMAKTV